MKNIYVNGTVHFLHEGERATYSNARDGKICVTSKVFKVLENEGDWTSETVFETENNKYHVRHCVSYKLLDIPTVGARCRMEETMFTGKTFLRTTGVVISVRHANGYVLIETQGSIYEVPEVYA